MRGVGEWCGFSVWSSMKVVGDFNSSMEVMYVPLKFLSVKVGGSWDE